MGALHPGNSKTEHGAMRQRRGPFSEGRTFFELAPYMRHAYYDTVASGKWGIPDDGLKDVNGRSVTLTVKERMTGIIKLLAAKRRLPLTPV